MPIDFKKGTVELAHGSGGRASSDLIDQLFMEAFDNPVLNQKNDQGRFSLPNGQLVMATDSHVISPLFFPGGNIGSLSVYGTVNDIVMSGAKAHHLSCGFILEEGFPLSQLKEIVISMATAAKECDVSIVTGDTKVVEKGHGDGVYINTTGIGVLPKGIDIHPGRIKPGDKIIVNGHIGDHGAAILAEREHISFEHNLTSDSQSLHDLVKTMVSAVPDIHCMRDPTRGGVAAILNELSQSSGYNMRIEKASVPINPGVEAITEVLGLDPLFMANEGKLIAICAAEDADILIKAMRNHEKGKNACVIGEVTKSKGNMVELITEFGGKRLLEWKYADPLPRIC